MSKFIKAVTAKDFEQEVVEKSKTTPVLIDFWAEWCAPCKQLMPLLHQIVDSLNGTVHLATVDTDAEQELSTNFGIRSLPTVLLMKNGEIVEQFMGVQPEVEIRKLLEPHLEPVVDKKPVSSDAMQKALELIKIYLQEGKINNAIESFAKLDKEQQEDKEAQTIKVILDLIQHGQQTKDKKLQQAIEQTVSINPQQGIEQLLELLAQAKGDDKVDIKKSLIIAFNLIDDAKLVSQLRRKMAALIF